MEAVIGTAHKRLFALTSTNLCFFHGLLSLRRPFSSRPFSSFGTRLSAHHSNHSSSPLSLSSSDFLQRRWTHSMRASPGKPEATKGNSSWAEEAAPSAPKSFSELGLSSLLLDQLEKEGLIAPTEVQIAAIPTIAQKRDVVIQSCTGSGKTLAYLLPILSELGPSMEEERQSIGVEAVIVAPSRELGMQIVREAERLLGPQGKKFVQQLVGGANRSRQVDALKKNKPLIIVGTPGRIAELSIAGKLRTHSCRFLVLDEVDVLLSFNYREDIHRILEHVGKRKASGDLLGPLARCSDRQTIMVSATVPSSVVRAARSWGANPLLVKGASVVSLDSPPESSTCESLPPGLKHYYCIVRPQHKVDTLRRCVHALDAKMVIAFMNSMTPLKDVVFKLEARGMKAAALHGDLSKLVRTNTLKSFKAGEVRVLATNELSARGLDVPECDLVVNLELPTDSVHYAHRAGRTGRLGRNGNVVTLCDGAEAFVVKKLRRQLALDISLCQFSEGKLLLCEEDDE